jgi:hypothetical protein
MRSRRPLVSFLSGLLSLVLIVGVMLGIGLYMGQKQFTEPGPLTADKVVVVGEGGSSEVAEQLKARRRHPFAPDAHGGAAGPWQGLADQGWRICLQAGRQP